MINQLYINGQDAFSVFGVTMGENFLSSFDTPAPLKEFIKNESRGEDGTQYLISSQPKVASRELTLNFIIQADSAEGLQANKNAFIDALKGGLLSFHLPVLNETARLLYTGKNVTYSLDCARTTARLGAKFIEPNPNNRAV